MINHQKYGRLTVVEVLSERSKDNHKLVRCICDCGVECVKVWSRVKLGRVVSCGCLSHDTKPNITHGMRYSTTYSSWVAAKNRCLCKTAKNYPQYGGKGITFYQPWAESFELFFSHIGERPKNTSLDRIDNTKGYEPGNCRWATRIEQQRNRPGRYVWYIQGHEFQTAEEAATYFGVTLQSICRWVLGYKDKRRNSFREAKSGCYRVSRY